MSASLHQNARILDARRRMENSFREMDAVVQHDRKILQMAHFENYTTNKIEQRTKQLMMEKKKKEYEDRLLHRKKRLADLYNEEMQTWRQEVLAKEETIEERKAKIMERAYALRDGREKARQAFVQQKLQEQWRDACDEARTLDSRALTLHMNQERIKQIHEKKDRRQALSHQEDRFLEEWNRQLAEMERRDKEKFEYKQRLEKETSQAIRKQIEDNEKLREEYYWKRMAEDEEELTRLRQEMEEEDRLQRQRLQESYSRGKEILAFNAENKKIKEEEGLIDREQDAILLDYALRKEQEAIAEEEAKRIADREAAKVYRKYLEEQMVKEAEDTAFVDEIRRQEEEKVWKARDEALRAREDARNYLMQMVDHGRQEQIHYKRHQEVLEKEQDAVFARRFLDEAQEAMRKEKEEAEARRRQALSNSERLNQQIAQRRQREALERQEAYLAEKQMKYMERVHQQRLAEQAGTIRVNFPLQKPNWYS
eukprot:gene1728-1888_t